MVENLIHKGADIEAQDNHQRTPLDVAIARVDDMLNRDKNVRHKQPRYVMTSPIPALLDNGANLDAYKSLGSFDTPTEEPTTPTSSMRLQHHPRLQRILGNELRRREIAAADAKIRWDSKMHREKLTAVVLGGRHERSRSRLKDLEDGIIQAIVERVCAAHTAEIQASGPRVVSRNLFPGA